MKCRNYGLRAFYVHSTRRNCATIKHSLASSELRLHKVCSISERFEPRTADGPRRRHSLIGFAVRGSSAAYILARGTYTVWLPRLGSCETAKLRRSKPAVVERAAASESRISTE